MTTTPFKTDYNNTGLKAEQPGSLITELATLLETYFNRNWFFILIEDIPVDIDSIMEMSRLLSIQTEPDEAKIRELVHGLDQFIQSLRRYVIPFLRQKLRISYLIPHAMIKDKNNLLVYRLIASVFPDNVNRLALLTDMLKEYCR
ncbi:MAG: hypothetical protein JW881_16020 [Spirochaetales bacterium]|nr:hypothetical protein [Spirochaetales bacterium]